MTFLFNENLYKKFQDMENKPFKNNMDFLSDDDFIKWRLYNDDELDVFWYNYIEQYPERKEDFYSAIEKFNAALLNKKELTDSEIDGLLEKIVKSANNKKKKKRILFLWSSVACIIILVATTIYIQTIQDNSFEITKDTVIGETLPNEDIQLISGNKIVNIKQNADINLSLDGQASIIEEGAILPSKINLTEEMNNLRVPYGKRSTLTLADGTKIWLNSGTEIDFPTNFLNTERRIKIRGEVYVDVVKDNDRPFIVETSQLDVQVLGTKLNISCYDQTQESVVLVEGRVQVKSKNETHTLYPGELLSFNADKVIHEKVDINEYISWIGGVFIFKKMTISDLLKKVGRYYNVDFRNNQSELMKRTCTGKLYLSEDIQPVLEVISAISNTSYEYSGKTILIKPK